MELTFLPQIMIRAEEGLLSDKYASLVVMAGLVAQSQHWSPDETVHLRVSDLSGTLLSIK